MTWSAYQHWDPLQVCVVGKSYPPEFYSWITVPRVRTLFERIAQETEEDYQKLVDKLESFGVRVLRPDVTEMPMQDSRGRFPPPPMTPRDYMVMIGEQFYCNLGSIWPAFYDNIRDSSWPDFDSYEDFIANASDDIKHECQQIHNLTDWHTQYILSGQQQDQWYRRILDEVKLAGNSIRHNINPDINGAMVSRIGRDLYFGTSHYNQDQTALRQLVDREFPHTRNHIVNTGGHSDGTFCPVTPGLIISLYDVPTYADTFPDWEVLYLPGQSWDQVSEFSRLKMRNKGKWWIPGFEHDDAVIDTVETWLGHWTGFVEETVFDVNMLLVNPTNIIVSNYNEQVFRALDRYGITAHVVPFRHRYFWDGGIHCVTADLHRLGGIQDFYPQRSS